MKILYHSPCYDGFGSAWAAWLSLGKDVEYLPARYGDAPPEFTAGETIYLVDFSYDRETIKRLRRDHRVIVIDHHRTAAEALHGLDDVTFDMEHSGAMLTWRHFHGDKKPPLLLRYIEDRDLWRFALPYSREIDGWVKSHAFDFQHWTEMANQIRHEFETCVAEGRAILRHQSRMVEMICDEARDGLVAGHVVPIVNTTAYWSEVGEELLRRNPEAPFVASYHDRGDRRRQYSLRSRDDFDCSEVAKTMGGGGHARAAGFVVDVHRWRQNS